MKLKNLEMLGMNEDSDAMVLPNSFSSVTPEPFYRGDGEHSILELEQLCRQYKERCYEQALIKQRLIEEIKKA